MAEDKKKVPMPVADDEAVRRQLDQQNKLYLSPKHYAAYILSGFGDKNWETFNGTNLFFFQTTFLGAKPSILSFSSAVCGVMDTFDNAISGPLIDRTRTRWGRVRPWLILTLPFWFFSAFVPWILPGGMSQTAIFVWFLALNYIGSIANSFYNPSYQAILFNLTPNVAERNRLIATDAYVDLAGVWLPSLFPFFVDYLPRSIPSRYIFMGGAFLFIASVVIFRTYGFFSLKERVPLASRDEMNQVNIIKTIKSVGTCRPMWVLLIKNFFALGKAVGRQVENYFWLNCMGKISLGTISGLFTGLPSYFVLPLAPKLTKKFGLRNLAAGSYMFCGISYFVMWLIGYKPTSNNLVNIIWIIFALTVCGSVNSIQRYCSTALNGDLYDYVEWKTGIRNEGTITAAMGYITLLTTQLSTILSGIIVDAIHYKPLLDANGVLVPQTDAKMLAGIWTIFALGPAIGRFMKGVTLLFFNVNGKTRETMMYELARIRAAKVIDTEPAEDKNQA
ncbi:MAG: MFS transporter [Clostridiaceae bacterium]|nr:MFS transporter [Clostridiaceae bacterium]